MFISIFIALLLIISTLVVVFIKKSKFNEYFTTVELILLFVFPILIAYVAFSLSTNAKERDWEFWGSTCVKAEYQERYGQWERESYECNCTTDKEGRRSCDTCYRMVCNKYGPYYYAYNEFDSQVSLTENQYKQLVSKFKNEKNTRVSLGSCPSGDLWVSNWNKDSASYQVFVQQKPYKNKVRFNAIYNPKYSKQLIKKLQPLNYPPINGIDQIHIVGSNFASSQDIKQANAILAHHAGIYGPKPHEQHGQVKPFIFTYINKPQQMVLAQRAYLEGGNKNEFIVLVNYDSLSKKISWYDIITYDEGETPYRLKIWLESNRSATLTQISKQTVDLLSKYWQRKHFTHLNEVIMTPIPTWIWIAGFFMYAISLVLIFVVAFHHE